MTSLSDRPQHSYRPSEGHGLAHDPLPAILGPRPIAWLSTRSRHGRFNLAPYSFFNVFNYRPPIVAFSSVGYKDTVRNVIDTGEFVCNLATRDLALQVNASSTEQETGTDEFLLTGLTPSPSKELMAPRVAESPVALECRVLEVRQLSDLQGTMLETWMVTGEVVHVHIDAALLQGGTYDTAMARPILRGGGPADYFEITPQARFQMLRPR